MLKHTRTVAAIAAASLLATFAAHANKGAEYKPHHEGKHHKKFEFTAGATYLEPSFDALDYLDVVTHNPTTPFGDTVNTYDVDPEFNWGYFLGFAYRISHHYDVQATWAQINTSSDDSEEITGSANTSIVTSNLEPISVSSGSTFSASSNQELDYQVFDATLGQYHDITDMLKTRLFAGLRYAKITSDIDNTYYLSGASSALFDEYDSSFSGVGPEVGLDLEYKIYKELGVVGSLAAAFLIGNQEANSNVYETNSGGQSYIDSDDNTRLIPALNAKLGMNWEIPYQMNDWGFGLEAGYQVAYYFDAADQIQYTTNPVTSGEVKHNYTDVGFMGPYLNFSAAF